jgi:DNA-binding transcriptional LysR family regulator
VLFGGLHIMPVVAEYLARYPDVTASCLFLDRVVNLLEEGVDVAVRIGELPDSSLQSIRVGQVRRVVCAAPAYLAQFGTPNTPEDLHKHCTISASSVTPTPEWRMLHNGELKGIKLHPRLTTTTNDSAAAAAMAGLGLTRLLSYQVADHVREGRLTTVLTEFEAPPLPVQVVHREGRNASQRVRAFLDLAIERLRANPALN